MKECSAGCIGCTLCQRNCPVGAAKVTDFLAKIDPETCKGCGICERVCPFGAIEMKEGNTNGN